MRGQICGVIVIVAILDPLHTDAIARAETVMDPIRTIACLAFPDVMSLDVTGPLQVFASANVERQRQGLPASYALQLLGPRRRPRENLSRFFAGGRTRLAGG